MTAMCVQLPGRVTGVRIAAAPSAGRPDASTAAAQRELAARLQAALDAQKKELGQAVDALQLAGAKFQQMQKQLIEDAEDQMLNLAFDIARKVLLQEIDAGRYEMDPIVKEALGRVPARQDVVVYLNPDDLALCKMAQESADSGKGGAVHFVADPSIPRANCRLESADDAAVFSVDEQLEDLQEALRSLK